MMDAAASEPFVGGRAEPRVSGLSHRFGKDPLVFEVSKTGSDGQRDLIRIFNQVRKQAGDPDLTRDEFVRRLKAMERFEVAVPERCRTCGGWKRVIPERGARGADGKIPCPACRGSGSEPQPYVVVWRADRVTHLGDRRCKYLSALQRELGDDASSTTWLRKARAFFDGALRDSEDAREFAHAAFEHAVHRANETWRHDEPDDSPWNSLQRRVIDISLEGISATAPKHGRPQQPQPGGSGGSAKRPLPATGRGARQPAPRGSSRR